MIGVYGWHDPILRPAIPEPPETPSNCPVTRGIQGFLNGTYRVFGRESHWKAYTLSGASQPIAPVNHHDFAVMIPDNEIEMNFNTVDFDITDKHKFVGRVFAGNIYVSLMCKAKYQVAAGYQPYGVEVYDDSDLTFYKTHLIKSGRTTGLKEKFLWDSDAVVSINYGDFIARFEDIIICTQPFSAGGDSGSSVWTIVE